LNNLTKGRPPFTVEQKGKIPKEYLKEEDPSAQKEKEDPLAQKEKEDPSAQKEKEDSLAREEDPSAQKEKQEDPSAQKETQEDPSAQKEKDPSVKKEKEKQMRIQKQKQKQKQDDRSELVLYIHDNELIKGIVDKAQFGKYGIVHTVHELYGADIAGILLSTFSRVFTLFLQVNLQITLPFFNRG
jgi:DNA-directed RNA polymerase I subunit RPA1